MEVINTFLAFKTLDTTQELDTKTAEFLNDLFGTLDKNKKNKKFSKKPNINILKNQKIQNKKDNIINKVNLILNKLSETNIDNLIVEFIENINQVDIDDYELILKAFYLKIIGEINFVAIYLQFLKIIDSLYNKVQSYNLHFFISIVESKFKLDYTDFDIEPDNKLNWVRDLDGETKRINNQILIKNLINQKFVSDALIDLCDNIILNQTVFLADIYFWFDTRKISNDYLNKIKLLLQKQNITPRETVLLENLIAQPTQNVDDVLQKSQCTNNLILSSTNIDTLKLECENIIEEYLLVKSLDDIVYFITNRCTDAITKNKFCEFLIDKYFMSNKESGCDIIELIKQLVKDQTLFKSNLSRGLLLIYNTWKDKIIDYNSPNGKMKQLLIVLKNIGITKGIEYIIELYKV
jgi:hypothetical protein